jgi:glycosyltransferase involved in cell wall biosynthesis
MAKLQNLIYVSNGNLPSKMAHTIQVAKMSQALAQKIENFELLTGGDIRSTLKGMDAEFFSWYGLHHKFKLVRLPTHLKVNYPFPPDYQSQNFCKLAALYVCLKSPSLVYTRDSRTAELLLSIGIPVLYEQHHPMTAHSADRPLLSNKNLVGFVTISPQLGKTYTEYGLSSEKLLIAHSAVDPTNFLPYQSKEIARQKLSLPLLEKLWRAQNFLQSQKIILYSGHLYEHKGVPTILETALLMPEYTFILVGGWESDINKVKEACKHKNILNIYTVGHVPQSDLATYLYAADVLLLPTSSSWEQAQSTSPLKLFEYMYAKRPIVASALPNIMTVLRDGENSILVAPDEPTAFKSAIEKLFLNPVLVESLTKTAFQEVQNFTWDNRAERIVQFAKEQLEQIDERKNNPGKNLMKYLEESYKRLSKKVVSKNK